MVVVVVVVVVALKQKQLRPKNSIELIKKAISTVVIFAYIITSFFKNDIHFAFLA